MFCLLVTGIVWMVALLLYFPFIYLFIQLDCAPMFILFIYFYYYYYILYIDTVQAIILFLNNRASVSEKTINRSSLEEKQVPGCPIYGKLHKKTKLLLYQSQKPEDQKAERTHTSECLGGAAWPSSCVTRNDVSTYAPYFRETRWQFPKHSPVTSFSIRGPETEESQLVGQTTYY